MLKVPRGWLRHAYKGPSTDKLRGGAAEPQQATAQSLAVVFARAIPDDADGRIECLPLPQADQHKLGYIQFSNGAKGCSL